MLGVLQSFEDTATRLRPIALVLPGLAAAGMGLFVWLGGLGFRRTGLAVVGAATGAVAGFCLANQRLGPTIVLATFGVFAGAVLPRVFTAVLAGVLGLVVAFLIVAWPLLSQDQGSSIGAGSAGDSAEKLSNAESLKVVRITAFDLTDSIKLAGRQLTPAQWGIVAVAGLGSLGGAVVMRHLGGALSCSVAGTGLVFIGLVLLLLNKGSAPITRIASRPGYYILVFLSMVVFGTVEQWLLCRRAGANKGKGRRKSKKSESDQGSSKESWRGR